MTTTRSLGLAQLSLLESSPEELIWLAAPAGFEFVGARVRPVTATERPYNLQPGSELLRDTLAAAQTTGVRIHDVEFILLDGTDQREAWLPMLEAGQALGARTLTVAASDPDIARLTDTLGQLTADAREHALMPTLELISYQAINTLPAAAELARAAGCQLVADTLHLARTGTTPEQLHEHADLVAMLQLCDGPAARPTTREGLVTESRSERMVPGEGDFPLAEYVAALPASVPLSVETPSDATLAAIGPNAWVERLAAGARSVIERAEAMYPAGR